MVGHVIVTVSETIDVRGLTLEQLFRVEWRQAASEKGHHDFNDLRPSLHPRPCFNLVTYSSTVTVVDVRKLAESKCDSR